MRLISQVLSWQSMGVVGPWPFYSIGDANTDWQTFIMRVSLGYFLFDFAWCLVMGSESVIMVMLWAAILGVCIDCRSSSIMSPLSLVLCSAWQRVSAAVNWWRQLRAPSSAIPYCRRGGFCESLARMTGILR